MNRITKILMILILFAALAWPGPASAAGLPDEIVLGENYTLESGQTLDGNLWVLGGNVVIEEGATVTGDVQIMGGNTQVDGTIDGDLTSFGSAVRLGETAVVGGDVNLTGGSLNQAPGSQILGEINRGENLPYEFIPRPGTTPGLNVQSNPFWDLISFLFQSFMLAALAALLAMFAPRPTARVARTVVSQPLIAGALGVLTAIIFPIVLLILVITLLGIPVAGLLAIGMALVLLFGWFAIGLELGNRMEAAFKQDFAPPVSAGIGTLVLSLVAGGVGRFIPCVGWIFPFLISMVGLGAVILTRAGTQEYPPQSTSVVVPATSYPPAPPPATVTPAPTIEPVAPFITPDLPQEPPEPRE